MQKGWHMKPTISTLAFNAGRVPLLNLLLVYFHRLCVTEVRGCRIECTTLLERVSDSFESVCGGVRGLTMHSDDIDLRNLGTSNAILSSSGLS